MKKNLIISILSVILIPISLYYFNLLMGNNFENFLYFYLSASLSIVILIPISLYILLNIKKSLYPLLFLIFILGENYMLFSVLDKNYFVSEINKTIEQELTTKMFKLNNKLKIDKKNFEIVPNTLHKTRILKDKNQMKILENDNNILENCIESTENLTFFITKEYHKCYSVNKKYNDYIKKDKLYNNINLYKTKIVEKVNMIKKEIENKIKRYIK